MNNLQIGKRYRYTGTPQRLGNCKLKNGDVILINDLGPGNISDIIHFEIERLPKYKMGISDWAIKRHLEIIE